MAEVIEVTGRVISIERSNPFTNFGVSYLNKIKIETLIDLLEEDGVNISRINSFKDFFYLDERSLRFGGMQNIDLNSVTQTEKKIEVVGYTFKDERRTSKIVLKSYRRSKDIDSFGFDSSYRPGIYEEGILCCISLKGVASHLKLARVLTSLTDFLKN